MRLYVVRHGSEARTGAGARSLADPGPGSVPITPASITPAPTPSHPSTAHDPKGPHDWERPIRRIISRPCVDPTTSSPGAAPGRNHPADPLPGGPWRPWPDHEVHIERVWPMRSPSTGSLEESSSAYFQSERRGTPPADIVPVGGLRMNQAFPHEPVMAAEVVELLAPVPPGLMVDATLGGAATPPPSSAAHPGITRARDRPRSGGGGRGHRGTGPLRGRGHHPPVALRRGGRRGRRRSRPSSASPRTSGA